MLSCVPLVGLPTAVATFTEMAGRMNVPEAQQMRFAKGPIVKKTVPKALLPTTLLVDHNLRLALPGWAPSLLVAFRLIILVRFFAGMYGVISDCDEGAFSSGRRGLGAM